MKVLVIEDQDFIRNVIVQLLEELGYKQVEAVESAEDALIMLKRGREFDCQLVDIRLNGMDGNEYMDKLKKFGFEIYTIVMTGFPSSVRCLGNDILLKPFSIQELDTALRKGHKKK